MRGPGPHNATFCPCRRITALMRTRTRRQSGARRHSSGSSRSRRSPMWRTWTTRWSGCSATGECRFKNTRFNSQLASRKWTMTWSGCLAAGEVVQNASCSVTGHLFGAYSRYKKWRSAKLVCTLAAQPGLQSRRAPAMHSQPRLLYSGVGHVREPHIRAKGPCAVMRPQHPKLGCCAAGPSRA